MKKLLLLTFLSLTIAANVSTKRFNFEVSPSLNQVDFSEVLGGNEGIFRLEFLYIINFNSIFSEPEDEDSWGQNLAIKFDGSYGESNCEISIPANGLIACGDGEHDKLVFIDLDNPTLIFYENDFEGCTGTDDCNWQISGTMYVDITGPFDDGVGSSDEIDDLQAQIDELVAQLTECVDCQGDLNDDETISVSDIVMLVEHILEGEDGDCYSQ